MYDMQMCNTTHDELVANHKSHYSQPHSKHSLFNFIYNFPHFTYCSLLTIRQNSEKKYQQKWSWIHFKWTYSWDQSPSSSSFNFSNLLYLHCFVRSHYAPFQIQPLNHSYTYIDALSYKKSTWFLEDPKKILPTYHVFQTPIIQKLTASIQNFLHESSIVTTLHHQVHSTWSQTYVLNKLYVNTSSQIH